MKNSIKNPRYSIIVPIYNSAATLKHCLDSILSQDYYNMELILINDGSTDNSARICAEYKQKYNSVIYIEKSNGGVSSARNAGLNVARGKYILFVDSDDNVTANYFSVLDRQDDNYDCVFFSQSIINHTTVSEKRLIPFAAQTEADSVPKFCEALYYKYLSSPFNKRYRRQIIDENSIRFPEHLYVGEDKSFSLKYVMCCKSCLILSDILYHVHIENQNSLSRKPRPDLEQQLELLSLQTQETIHSADISEEYRQQYIVAENLIQLRAIYSNAKRMHLSGLDIKRRRQKIKYLCQVNNDEKASLPSALFSILLQIPVRLKMITIIDLLGWYLSQK